MQSKIVIITIIIILIITAFNVHAQSTYTSTHFIIYDLANAGQSYDEELDNYLEQAYSLYTSLGMKMAPPCNGTKYAIYVVPSAQEAGEAGITYWGYSYNSSTNQVLSSCVIEINITANLSTQLLQLTAYHELVHVSQAAYWQYVNVIQAYPWYIEADAEGTAEYYTDFCPLGTQYFSNQQYEYDPYDYSGKPIINMYYYASFIYWLIANGISPATIESNVFVTNTVNVPWLNNYYVQYLLSLVHGQNLCGQTYYPTFQQVNISSSQYSFSVSLQGLSAQYYEVQLPASGTIEITTSGNTVESNVLLNQAFTVSNTTLYMALVNPSTNSITITVTITYTPGISVKIVNATYNVLNQSLTVKLYVIYGGMPVTGTVYINGVSAEAIGGYVETVLNNINWSTIELNVTYVNASAIATLTLNQISASLPIGTLYLTSTSFGYIPLIINNPNNAYVVTNIQVTTPPSPTGLFKPMVYFEEPNMTITLKPGANSIDLEFYVNSSVSQGQGSIYIKVNPSESITLGYSIIPVSVNVVNATYIYSTNSTEVTVSVSNIGYLTSYIKGLSGVVYINYTTYVIAMLTISIPSFNISITPSVSLEAPTWALLNITITLSAQSCPQYPVNYEVPITINGTSMTTESLECGERVGTWVLINETYKGTNLALTINGYSFEMPMKPPLISICNNTWLLTNSSALANVTLCVTGPYKYLILNREISNSSMAITETAPLNTTEVLLNVGFINLTLNVPRLNVSIALSNLTLYPNPVTGIINISLPSNAEYWGSISVIVNGTVINESMIKIPMGSPLKMPFTIKPYLGPGIYVITVKMGPFTVSEGVYDVEVRALYIRAKTLTLIGGSNNVTVTLVDKPGLALPINITLSGCVNKSLLVRSNTTITLTYYRECSVTIKAQLLNVVNETVLYWDDLNLVLTNTIGEFQGLPLIIMGPVTAKATFTNGTTVPTNVFINGTASLTIQSPGPVALLLQCEYLGVGNSTYIHAYAVPSEYLYAEDVLNELGNPQPLNESIAQAITTGNWSLVTLFLNYYNETLQRPDDPIMLLTKYLLTQYAMNGNPQELSAAMLITRYEVPIYISLTLIVVLVIALFLLRKRRLGKP